MERKVTISGGIGSILGFNGATSRRTWRGMKFSGTSYAVSELQWGHVQKDMERATKGYGEGEWSSFNGATSRRTWREQFILLNCDFRVG